MASNLHLVTLGVADLARSRTFYEAVFDWPVSAASQDDVVFFKSGGAAIALYPLDKLAEDAAVSPGTDAGFTGVTLAHNVKEKADVAPLIAKAKAAGAVVTKPAQDAFWGRHHGYFADPDGYLWEIAWNPFFPFDEDGSLKLP
jgi:catechol 2,3-dioxygenase-like lactoylglutathione lyase family enzyme